MGNGVYSYSYGYRDMPGNSILTTGQIASMSYTGAGAGLSFSYTYDSVGNISSYTGPEGTTTYTYGDASWKDLLTAFDGQSITYDGSGNPLSYYNGTR